MVEEAGCSTKGTYVYQPEVALGKEEGTKSKTRWLTMELIARSCTEHSGPANVSEWLQRTR